MLSRTIDGQVTLDIARGTGIELQQTENSKAFCSAFNKLKKVRKPMLSRTYSHTCAYNECSVYEAILLSNFQLPKPLVVRFISSSRNNVRFEVEDETAGEIFEEDIRYATQSMPTLVVEALIKILEFYDINLDNPSIRFILDLAKRAVCAAEGRYGSQVANFDMFDADSVLIISNDMQYHPCKGIVGKL